MFATAPVTAALSPVQAMPAVYTTSDWHVVECGRSVEFDGGLAASAIPLGAKRPRYAAPTDAQNWVVAYQIRDERTGGALVYAPRLPVWPEAFADAVARPTSCCWTARS